MNYAAVVCICNKIRNPAPWLNAFFSCNHYEVNVILSSLILLTVKHYMVYSDSLMNTKHFLNTTFICYYSELISVFLIPVQSSPIPAVFLAS